MKIEVVAKITGAKQDLISRLLEQNISSRAEDGTVFIGLPFSVEDSAFQVIPEIRDLPNVELLIHVAESGGAKADGQGAATVVCGVKSGGALQPYHIPVGGGLTRGEHAYFLVGNSVVTITADTSTRSIRIEQHRIVIEDKFAALYTKLVWEGFRDDLPEELEHYSAAALAAEKKSRHVDCRTPHYMIKSVNGN